MKVIMYSRDNGPTGFKVSAHDDDALEALAKIVSSNTVANSAWIWASDRNGELPPGSSSLSPSVRPPTVLTRETWKWIVSDFKERDANGEGRSLTLFGLDKKVVRSGALPDDLRQRLVKFDQGEESGIHFVLSLLIDSGPYIFVPKTISSIAAAALEALRIDDASLVEERPYKKMRRSSLECQIDGIVCWVEELQRRAG